MSNDPIRCKLWADIYTCEVARGKHWLEAKGSADSAVQQYDRMPAIEAAHGIKGGQHGADN